MADVSSHVESGAAAALARRRARLLRIIGLVVVAFAIGVTVWWLLFARGRVSTDNAFVGANTAVITPLIAGNVVRVPAESTRMVDAGAVLVMLDDADARIAVAQAEAAVAQAEQRYGQAGATAKAARARLAARAAEIAAARARLAEANAALDRSRQELARRQGLASTGAVSAEELSTARAAFEGARAARDSSAAAVAAADATEAAAGGDFAAANALVAGTTRTSAPEILSARAQLARARLDLERTVIRAPIAGVVTNKNVQLGQRVAAGTPILSIVPTDSVFVDANFKESQLGRMRPGQQVELTSDLYGDDVVFHGRVVGFSGGTGAAFALIPAQNATGNWVKVVQRLPVRIALDPAEVRAHPLRVGLSMEATVDVRGH